MSAKTRGKSDTRLRPARADDYEFYARLYPELATGEAVPDRGFFERVLVPGMMIAELDGAPIGFCVRDVLASSGYVRQIVVEPAHRRAGLGEAILRRVEEDLRRTAAVEWRLNVKPDNLPAIALYEKLGMRRRYLSAALRLPWSAIDRLTSPQQRCAVTLIAGAGTAAVDERIERKWQLPTGQLEHARQQGRRVLALHRGDEDQAALPLSGSKLLGVAVFDPGYPGAFPFRVVSPSLAHRLLEAMRSYAEPRFDYVGVVVDDDEPLASALLAAGATLKFEFAHYVGALVV